MKNLKKYTLSYIAGILTMFLVMNVVQLSLDDKSEKNEKVRIEHKTSTEELNTKSSRRGRINPFVFFNPIYL